MKFSNNKLALCVLEAMIVDNVYYAVVDEEKVNECATDLFGKEMELTDKQHEKFHSQYQKISEKYLASLLARIRKELYK